MELVSVRTPWGDRGSFSRTYATQTALDVVRDDAVSFYRAGRAPIGEGPFGLSSGASLMALELTVEEAVHSNSEADARFGPPPIGGLVLRLVPIYLGDPSKKAARLF